ncbi:MAG: phytoene desaturase family protein [Candidatus Sericytochromatia bacterium]
MKKNIVVIGSGFSGLSTAVELADNGAYVTVIEKNDTLGGRARLFKEKGFTFDMGPSWYWMPEVFENFFEKYGKKVSDYYNLVRLDPSYRVIFGKNDYIDLPANLEELKKLFESLEEGSAENLELFLEQAKYKYETGMNNFVHKPSVSLKEFIEPSVVSGLFKLDLLSSFHKHIRKFFKNDKIIKIMEFPILFLGATPQKTPAMYSLMNYADIVLGTWYPLGGMFNIIDSMVNLAKDKGVEFVTNTEISELEIKDNNIIKIKSKHKEFKPDVVVASADYNHVETKLLPKDSQSYSEEYWNKRIMSPSSLLFYLGINKKLKNLEHHNLFFDTDFSIHAKEIYETPVWPSQPLFYVSVPSKTDSTVAPENNENVFILIPVAPNLEDTEQIREKYYNIVMDRLEDITGQRIRENVIFKRSYAHKDFKKDYNAFKGNAYGLANTLNQTAILKPSIKSKKVNNLFYTGQLTVPGPGVPPSIISGQVVAKQVISEFFN